MNFQKKVFLFVASIICLLSLFILVSSIINIAQKQYIFGSFYTLQKLIIILVISSLIVMTSIAFIMFQIKRK